MSVVELASSCPVFSLFFAFRCFLARSFFCCCSCINWNCCLNESDVCKLIFSKDFQQKFLLFGRHICWQQRKLLFPVLNLITLKTRHTLIRLHEVTYATGDILLRFLTRSLDFHRVLAFFLYGFLSKEVFQLF